MPAKMQEELQLKEDLKSLIFDESEVVTWKVLARRSQISRLCAQKLLEDFVKTSNNGDHKFSWINVITGYGLSENDEEKVHKVLLVSNEDLKKALKLFNPGCCVQVFSIQTSSSISDSVLHSAEKQTNETLRHSKIQFSEAVLGNENNEIINVKKTIAVETKKPEPFSKKIEAEKKEIQETKALTDNKSVKHDSRSSKSKIVPKTKKGSLEKMFANAPPVQKKSDKLEKKKEVELISSNSSSENEETKNKTIKKPPVKNSKRNEIKNTSGKKNSTLQKHRRIITPNDLSSSNESSESENEENMISESPIPLIFEEKTKTSDDSKSNGKVEKPTNENKMHLKRRLVEEMVTNEDGYLETRKKWVPEIVTESSEMEIQDEAQVQANTVKYGNENANANTNAKDINTKETKDSQAKSKQATLMSFFRKK